MFESLIPQMSDLNVQVPVSYIVTAVAVLFGTYWTVSKLFTMAKLMVAFVFTRFSLAMLGSGALFLTGLAGLGNSTSNIVKDSNSEPKDGYVYSSAVMRILTNPQQDIETKKLAFEYAKMQDSKMSTQYISTDNNVPTKNVSKTGYWTMFTTSMGMVLMSIVWMCRRWHEVA